MSRPVVETARNPHRRCSIAEMTTSSGKRIGWNGVIKSLAGRPNHRKNFAPANKQLTGHEFYLVYPFDAKCRDITQLEMWCNYAQRLDPAQVVRETHDLFAFLPHVRSSHYNRFISQPDGADEALASGYVKSTNAVRLTLRDPDKPENLRYFPSEAIVHRADSTAIRIRLTVNWIDIILYPPGFGFLIYKMSTDDLTVETAGIVHRSIKKVHYRDRLRVKPPILLRDNGSIVSEWPSILRSLLSEFAVDPDSDFAQTHASSFRVVSLSIGSLANDSVSYGNIDGSEEGHLISLITGEDLSTISHPGSDLVRAARGKGRLNYWRDWSAIFLWDDVAFMGTETEFTKNHLVRNVELLYLPLFVYALFQYLRLNQISVKLTDLSARSRSRKRQTRADVLIELERLNSDLRFFRGNYMFWEISRQPVMAALFNHLVAHFETRALYEQIEHDIERLYLEERTRAQERIAFYAGLATFFALPVGALLAVFNQSISDSVTGGWRGLIALLVILISVLVWRSATGYRLRHSVARKLERRAGSFS